MLQVRGDWEFFETAFRFRSVGADSFCWLCDATKSCGTNCAWNFKPTAPHRTTLMSHERCVAMRLDQGTPPPSLFQSPGFNLEFVAIDSMHAGDLGVFQDAVGSLFWLEVWNHQWHRSKKAGLRSLHNQLKKYYTANKDKGYSEVFPTERQIRADDPGFPYLKAKAAETRHLAEFCLVLANVHRSGGDRRPPFRFAENHPMAGKEREHLHHIVALFEGLASYHRSVLAEPFQPDVCKAAMYRFLNGFGALHDLWRAGQPEPHVKRAPFHYRPKIHMLQHLVEEQLFLWGSPLKSWCYRDEDHVGTVKRTAGRSKFPGTLEARLNEKLMLLAGLHALYDFFA